MSGRALLVDYGGVLTANLDDAWDGFELAHGLPRGTMVAVLRAGYGTGSEGGPIARLERGEMTTGEFEVALLRLLEQAVRARGGDPSSLPAVDGLIERLFGALRPTGGVWDLVTEAREAGHGTVLLSNSWGFSAYPRARLSAAFDHLVISGEVGMRKPEARIYLHAAGLVGAEPAGCVVIDDLQENVDAAEDVGMTGVLHVADAMTRAAVTAALGL